MNVSGSAALAEPISSPLSLPAYYKGNIKLFLFWKIESQRLFFLLQSKEGQNYASIIFRLFRTVLASDVERSGPIAEDFGKEDQDHDEPGRAAQAHCIRATRLSLAEYGPGEIPSGFVRLKNFIVA